MGDVILSSLKMHPAIKINKFYHFNKKCRWFVIIVHRPLRASLCKLCPDKSLKTQRIDDWKKATKTD
jgi:hypothetical protein